MVHRGNCYAIRDVSKAATAVQARTAVERPVPVCQPDRAPPCHS
ncbi:DUF6233 domain-containing protein [Actinacidiphila glaucinigra]